MKTYILSDDRIVVVKKGQGSQYVVMKQKDSDVKCMEFTSNRWAQFRQAVEDIETNLKSLRAGDNVSFKHPIGGGYYISITSGFYCIDFRKFFLPYGETEVNPTRRGLALRLSEWEAMKRIMDAINTRYPSLGTALPCYMGDDHLNQIGALQCRDCYPFSTHAY